MTDNNQKKSDASSTAKIVSDFYERHPYPPAIDNLDRYGKQWAAQRRQADYHLSWPFDAYRDDFSILIAGCGTSQAAKYAMRWPKANVTGIDVSGNSIRHTEKLKQKYKLNNLKVAQLPVEESADLGQHFDLIVSTGVLHHLPNPDLGLMALRNILAPDGAMHIMVYAPYGRAGVYLLQDYCRRLGIGNTSSDIRDLAISLSALPPDHPLVPLLRNAPDFQNEAALADALLHPQDRAYTVPELFEFLNVNGLRFGRWIRQAPYQYQCGGLANSPHNSLISQLPLKEQFAAVELFRGTMVRHSVIAYSSDNPASKQQISFDKDLYLDYVPIRLPDTIVVEQNLPPGATAVLINQNHTYTDLYLPIGKDEKQWFDAIDGKRTISQIIKTHTNNEPVKQFFERLWLYDQVLFNTS